MKMLQHRFVEFIPDIIEEGFLFVSLEYCTAIHNCVCGCGGKVVTPISPTDWQMYFNGRTITLTPSIGNWNFDCKSHYFIRGSEVEWCSKWSKKEIADGRKHDLKIKEDFYKESKSATEIALDVSQKSEPSGWQWLSFLRFWK